MALTFLDANIIIRHVTKDDIVLSKQAYSILQRIEKGSVIATTCEAVLAEVVYVLSSRKLYNFSRKQIRDVLDVILAFPGLKLPHKNVYKRALKIYVSS